MTLSCISEICFITLKDTHLYDVIAALVIPAAYHASKLEAYWHMMHNNTLVHTLAGDDVPSFDDVGISGILAISRGTSILLLIIYLTYLYFQLGSHAYLFETPSDVEEEGPKMNMASASVGYVSSAQGKCFNSHYNQFINP